jgi:hypothetical protein
MNPQHASQTPKTKPQEGKTNAKAKTLTTTAVS